MHEIKLGIDTGDHVIISIDGRPDESDDWLAATITIAAGAFSGCVSAALVTPDFPRFRRELETLYNSLDGTATFTTIERQLELEFTGNGHGGIAIRGTIEDRAGGGNTLGFQFETDQTFLPDIITQIRQVENDFPNRWHPNIPQ
jgi:hypothetical protein